jgi:hypothetical protein
MATARRILKAHFPFKCCAAERALRGLALGRKAWLFAGSDRGRQRAALLYSLIVTAKLNDVDPQALARRRAASDQRSPSLASP